MTARMFSKSWTAQEMSSPDIRKMMQPTSHSQCFEAEQLPIISKMG
jgi:hypothetical protein